SVSDMMFPFAMSLYSDEVQQRLNDRGCTITETFGDRFGYEIGFRTLLNVLRRAETLELEEVVCKRGKQFSERLSERLRGCRNVREIWGFGLLIGIEMETSGVPRRWLKRLLPQLYLLAMLNHRTYSVIAGFCQYEPNVLKLTPPLTITEEEVE